jgi:hypothetical protein
MDVPWEAIGGALGFGAAVAFSIIGWFGKNLVADLKQSISDVEKDVKELTNGCVSRHEALPGSFVPRSEVDVIRQSLKEAADEQRREIRSLHNKMDSLILMVKNGA